jgi:putative transcriptional regulator
VNKEIDSETQQFYEGLLTSVRQMKKGQTKPVYTPVIEARQQTGLSQASFAKLLGVSVRTCQEWEQGRRQPTGAARTLIAIAHHSPEALRAVALN